MYILLFAFFFGALRVKHSASYKDKLPVIWLFGYKIVDLVYLFLKNIKKNILCSWQYLVKLFNYVTLLSILLSTM